MHILAFAHSPFLRKSAWKFVPGGVLPCFLRLPGIGYTIIGRHFIFFFLPSHLPGVCFVFLIHGLLYFLYEVTYKTCSMRDRSITHHTQLAKISHAPHLFFFFLFFKHAYWVSKYHVFILNIFARLSPSASPCSLRTGNYYLVVYYLQ